MIWDWDNIVYTDLTIKLDNISFKKIINRPVLLEIQ